MTLRAHRSALSILAFAVAVLPLAQVAGCGSGGGDAFKLADAPVIDLNPATVVSFNRGGVPVGGETTSEILIRNTGESGNLVIEEIRLEYFPASAGEAGNPAIFLVETPPIGTEIAPLNKGSDTVPESARIVVGYRNLDDDNKRQASLVIVHNDARNSPSTVNVVEEGALAALQASPAVVGFQTVTEGKFDDRKVRLLNTGNQTLDIMRIQLTGDDTFSLLVDPESETDVLQTGQPLDLDPPLVIEPGSGYEMRVRFSPRDRTPQSGSIVIASSDETLGAGLQIPLKGNHAGPCIEVEPPNVFFGAKLVGTPSLMPVRIKSCGATDLVVEGLRLKEGSNENFELDNASFVVHGELAGGTWPTELVPRSVPVNGVADFNIQYTPISESADDPEGSPVPDLATLLIDTNTFDDVLEVEIEGYGTLTPCPTAVISLENSGTEFPPQTRLRFTAEGSLPNTGVITAYKWDVTQPPGSASVFIPSPNAPKVEFEANVAGRYVFRLEVQDAEAWSCPPASRREIAIVPDEAIHVELTWNTPDDPDPTDEGPGSGADMDLHFVHLENSVSLGSGEDLYPPPHGDGTVEGYFSDIWDTFWFYPQRDWGSVQRTDDNPTLDRDDVDGAGPENLNLNGPEDGITYKIGVHYWRDHGYGPSTPTVNIFIFGSMREQKVGCPMVTFDMWEVGTIAWPSETVDLWTCDGSVPPPDPTDLASWPARPCGNASNTLPDGSTCPLVMMREYKPENFFIDF